MRIGFYPKLAWEGMRKNKRFYIPYLLTCIGMVMMHYIIAFLSGTPALESTPGGATIGQTLGMGSTIVALFSLLFLFYSNSFLNRRRQKEFGLYNILGMSKWNIARILFWESVIVGVISLGIGLAAGGALAKLFELGLINMMEGEITYHFEISFETMKVTVLVFAGILVLLFLNSLRQISLKNPITLLRSENAGEKPPKANWLIGIAGLIILGWAYYIAITMENPVSALVMFFVAVAMVIVATYLLFTAGSVILCKMLQKNKRYYYKTNHFISVSSMTYRMKRNGAGLASICILLTMVLVMLSSTAALYIGTEDVMRIRYPKEINLNLTMQDLSAMSDETLDIFREKVDDILEKHDMKQENVVDYHTGVTSGIYVDGTFCNDEEAMKNFSFDSASDAALLYVIPLSDYNQIMNEQETLAEDEVLIYAYNMEYKASVFQMNEGIAYQVKKAENWINNGNSVMTIIPTIFVFTSDFENFVEPMLSRYDSESRPMMDFEWLYGFDCDLGIEEQIAVYNEIAGTDWMRGLEYEDLVAAGNVESRAAERSGFYSLYGGLFYLGILLSIVFLFAAVLIIYYKQVSEGFEDQKRFEIMQKVGMTKKDIRRSINSQMLTVFFLPLLMAGIHLCFAFPIIRLILQMFALWNTKLLIATCAFCFIIFGLFYALVYRITSNSYYAIVSEGKE